MSGFFDTLGADPNLNFGHTYTLIKHTQTHTHTHSKPRAALYDQLLSKWRKQEATGNHDDDSALNVNINV